jgi:RHS repeat-associated protein
MLSTNNLRFMRTITLLITCALLNLAAWPQANLMPAVMNTHDIVISGKTLVKTSELATYTAYLLHPEDIRPVEWIVTGGTITAQNTDPSSGPIYVSVQWPSFSQQTNYSNPLGAVNIKRGTVPQDNIYDGAILEVYPGVHWSNGTNVYPDAQTVSYGQQPCLLSALQDPFNTGGSGTYVYRWQKMDNVTYQWNDIPGASGVAYQAPGLTESTCFRRVTEWWVGPNLIYYEEPRGVWVYLHDPLNAGTLYAVYSNVSFNGEAEIYDEMPYGGSCESQYYLYRWEVSYNYRAWETFSFTLHYANPPAFKKKNVRIRRGVRCGGGQWLYSNILEFHMTEDIQPDENRNYMRTNNILVKGIESRIEAYQLATGGRIQETTYYDGAGRPVQVVSKETGTPDAAVPGLWKDVVGIKAYDKAGREANQYLPYTTTSDLGKFKTTAVTEQLAYYSNTATFNEAYPYTQITFENSPLSRVLNVKLPGTVWGASGGNGAEYDFNDISENVQMWSIDNLFTSKPSSTGAYLTGRLQKTSSIDDKGKLVVEYTDAYGKLILRKVQKDNTPTGSHNGWLCTYNVYDDMGRLRVILTPEATNTLENNGWLWTFSAAQNVFDELCHIYFYDAKGRIVERKAPGCEKTTAIYDTRNRLVLTQDGNQRELVYQSSYQWTYMLYDNLDRPVVTGLMNTSVNYSREALRDLVDALGNDDVQVSITTNVTENIIAYNPVTSGSFCAGCTLGAQAVSYYDNYGFSGKKNFDTDFDNYTIYPMSEPNVNPIVQSTRTLNASTGNKSRVIGTSTFLASTMYYDENGRLIQSLEDNLKGGTDARTMQYHFDGRKMSSFIKHSAPGTAMSNFRTLTKNSYDVIGRLTEVWKKYGSAAIKQVSSYAYNDLGRVATQKLGPSGTAAIEARDYFYNLHGSVIGINKDYALKKDWAIDPGKKWEHFFGIYLGYDNRDNLFTAPRLDGKITGMIWNSQGDDAQRKYNFEYDNVGQLENAVFTQRENTTHSWGNTKADFSVSSYTGKIEYDLNGNILSLSNRGIIPGNAPMVIDDLRYTYIPNANKLLKVQDVSSMGANNGKLGDFKDGSNGSGDDFDYDKNGNLVLDNNKEVKNLSGFFPKGIKYNYLGKIEEVSITGTGTIQYTYDAGGNKLEKKFTAASTSQITTTTYIGNFIYENNVLRFIHFGDGRVRVIDPVNQGNTYDYLLIDGNISLPGNKEGVFDYFLKDHQGSTRLTVTEEIHSGKNTCTMEWTRDAFEESLFGQVNADQSIPNTNEVKVTRWAKANIPGQQIQQGWNSLPSNSDEVSRLTALIPGRKLGPNSILKVMAGDVINAGSVYYYKANPGGGDGASNIVTDLITAFAGLFNSLNVNPLIKAGGTGVTNPLNVPLHSYLDNQDNVVDGTPKAYLTVLFFDEQFNFVSDGCMFDRVDEEEDVQRDPLRILNAKAPKTGYAFVYLSNESDEFVYFDDFWVEHTRGRIVEENHYYPFGQKMAGISSRKLGSQQNGMIRNIYGFQGTFSEEEEYTGWNEFELRDYDPQIGKWIQPDPYHQFASGYIAMANDPVNFTDPGGGWTFPMHQVILGATIGAFVGGIIDASTGGDGFKGLAIGLLAGAVGGYGVGVGFGALPIIKTASNMAVSGAVTGIMATFYDVHGKRTNEMPDIVRNVFRSEYGIQLKYADGYLQFAGLVPTTMKVSEIAQIRWIELLSGKRPGGIIAFGYKIGLDTEIGLERLDFGVFDPGTGITYIDLDDFTPSNFAARYVRYPMGVSSRVWNLARILEHEHLGHFSIPLTDSNVPGLPFPTDGGPGPLEKEFGNPIRTQLGLPHRITYLGNGPNGGEGFWLGTWGMIDHGPEAPEEEGYMNQKFLYFTETLKTSGIKLRIPRMLKPK